jgi:hypothetical protein
VQVVPIERGRVGNGCFITKNGNSPCVGASRPPSPRCTGPGETDEMHALAGSNSVDFSGEPAKTHSMWQRGAVSIWRLQSIFRFCRIRANMAKYLKYSESPPAKDQMKHEDGADLT